MPELIVGILDKFVHGEDTLVVFGPVKNTDYLNVLDSLGAIYTEDNYLYSCEFFIESFSDGVVLTQLSMHEFIVSHISVLLEDFRLSILNPISGEHQTMESYLYNCTPSSDTEGFLIGEVDDIIVELDKDLIEGTVKKVVPYINEVRRGDSKALLFNTGIPQAIPKGKGFENKSDDGYDYKFNLGSELEQIFDRRVLRCSEPPITTVCVQSPNLLNLTLVNNYRGSIFITKPFKCNDNDRSIASLIHEYIYRCISEKRQPIVYCFDRTYELVTYCNSLGLPENYIKIRRF